MLLTLFCGVYGTASFPCFFYQPNFMYPFLLFLVQPVFNYRALHPVCAHAAVAPLFPSHVEAVLVAANLTGAKPKTARAKARKIREAVRRGRDSFKATAPHSDSSCERDDSSQGEKSGEEEAGSLDPEGGRAIGRTFESSGFVSKKHPGLGPLREYKTEDIGRLKDLVGDGERGQAEVHLKAECLRFASSVTTTVCAGGWGHRGGREGGEGEGRTGVHAFKFFTGRRFDRALVCACMGGVSAGSSGRGRGRRAGFHAFHFSTGLLFDQALVRSCVRACARVGQAGRFGRGADGVLFVLVCGILFG